MGKIKITRDSTSLELVNDLALQRSAGRPNAELDALGVGTHPRYKDKPRPASDVFEIGGVLKSTQGGTSAEEKARRFIEDIIRDPLGGSSLTLEFLHDPDDDGTFTTGWLQLDSYQVVPFGGQSGRATWSVGENGVTRIDNVSLRVVG